jgi:hypothetical protein
VVRGCALPNGSFSLTLSAQCCALALDARRVLEERRIKRAEILNSEYFHLIFMVPDPVAVLAAAE